MSDQVDAIEARWAEPDWPPGTDYWDTMRIAQEEIKALVELVRRGSVRVRS